MRDKLSALKVQTAKHVGRYADGGGLSEGLENSASVSAVSLSQSANFNCGHTFRQRDTETRSKQSLKVGSDKPSRCNIIRSPGTTRCQGFCLSPNRNMRSQRGLKQRRQPRLAISRMR